MYMYLVFVVKVFAVGKHFNWITHNLFICGNELFLTFV
jgi:hypothetical protein